MTSITIPDSVTSIGAYAFYDCRKLIKINISSIEAWCNINFQYSSNPLYYGGKLYLNGKLLTELVIPESVMNISEKAFYGCNNIATIFYPGSQEAWENIYIASGNDILNSAVKVYKAVMKTYKFETNCASKLEDITNYAVMTAPKVKNGDKTLIGWYDNESLTGNPVVFPYYGEADTLYAAWTDRTGLSFDDAFISKANEEYSVTIAESEQIVYYEFVPRLTGEYRFYSKGNLDTYGYLYDSKQRQLTSNDDGGENNNFKITYNLTAGETYYIAVKLYNGTGNFTLVTETDCIESTKTVCVTANTGEKIFISILSYLPENASVILACYKDNALSEVQVAVNKNETLYFVAKNDFDSAKIMVWSSLADMTPICEAEAVK